MDGFANYDSDSEEEGNEGQDEGEGNTGAALQEAEAKIVKGGEPEAKKRRVLPKPGVAMTSAPPSFLASNSKPDVEEHFSRVEQEKETPQPTAKHQDPEPAKLVTKIAPTAGLSGGRTAADLSKSKEKEKETTRQKNTRKQKLGQANFTVKDNRECPDLWRG
mmetsp:Transcript_24129/g.48385  ORF Transcript_24129/g.48385 Transcript_24129/m.48385 type:complete len:162 (+) Transcript_24129:3-488(+)